MRRYGVAAWPKAPALQSAVVRMRMSPPHRQSVTRISEKLGIHVMPLYNWRKA